MTRRYRTNDGEWERRPPARDIGTDALPLFAGETGVDAPSRAQARARESGAERADRILEAMAAQRRDWIERIHAALVDRLGANGYEGVVSANEARAVYLTFPDANPAVDYRFLAALWKQHGWELADWFGVSEAPGTHGRKIARYRYNPSAAERARHSTEAA
jgi:hypothetical protein